MTSDLDLESRLRGVLTAEASTLPPSTMSSDCVLDDSRAAVEHVLVTPTTRRGRGRVAMVAAAAAVVAVAGAAAVSRTGSGADSSSRAGISAAGATASAAWPDPCPQELPDGADVAGPFDPYVQLLGGQSGDLQYRVSYRVSPTTLIVGVCTWQADDPAATISADVVGQTLDDEIAPPWHQHRNILFLHPIVAFHSSAIVQIVPESVRTAELVATGAGPSYPLAVSSRTFGHYRLVFGDLPWFPGHAPRWDARDAAGNLVDMRFLYVPFHEQYGR